MWQLLEHRDELGEQRLELLKHRTMDFRRQAREVRVLVLLVYSSTYCQYEATKLFPILVDRMQYVHFSVQELRIVCRIET